MDNNTVFVSATEPILYKGCDFRLYWGAAGLAFFAGLSVFCIWPLPQSLYGIGAVALAFMAGTWGLRETAKADPLALPVYLRHIKWPAWMPANPRMGHVVRNNTSRRPG